MSLSSAQVAALRFGAVMLLLAGVVLAVVAVVVDSSPSRAGVTLVDDPSSIPLKRGFLGGRTIVYGVADQPGVAAADLGCRLLSKQGTEQSSAKLSHLRVLSSSPVTVDGQELQPLFSVSDFPRGATVACDDASAAEPLAVSAPSTFGERGGLVKAVAGSTAVLALLLGALTLILTRRRAGS